MRKSFKYKAIISKSTAKKASEILHLCRTLYNLAITERRLEYQNFKNHFALLSKDKQRRRLSAFDQSKQLTELKELFPEFKQVPSQALQDVTERVGKAQSAAFRSFKKTGKFTKPRYKGRDRYKSFTLKQSGWKLEGRHLRISGIGIFKLRLSRPIQGTIKTITISHSNGDWFVSFSCDNVPAVIPIGPAKPAVGIDLGLTHFYTDSEGNKVANPRYLKKSADSLAVAQRALAKKKRGSKNRVKCRRQLSKKHKKVSNSRRDFHYKTAKRLVANFHTIVMEDLNIKDLILKDEYNKSIHDVGWGNFEAILIAKAEEAGRRVLFVDPKYTSQDCSECGARVAKSITEREHICPCGAKMCRDVNAARNIVKKGGFSLEELSRYSRFGRSRSELVAV